MAINDVRNGHSWAWLLVLYPWGIAVETGNHPPLIISSFLRLLAQLCSLLHPFNSEQNHVIFVPHVTYEPVDHFGCKSVLATLKTNITSTPKKWSEFLILSARNLIQWRQKLIGVTITNAMSNSSNYFTLLRRPVTTLTTPATSSPTTTTKPYRWNKGLSRYDNSWGGTDFNNKFSGRELIFYDHYDPSKKQNSQLHILHSTLRILPAIIIIAFLILCWYCFVFRRMRRRHRRTRTLLSQYQALLNGHSTSIVVSNPDGHVVCSSSTFDSCLNDNSCDAESSTDQRPQRNIDNVVTSRPTSYPPTYDEIFPPPYDSLYGNVV